MELRYNCACCDKKQYKFKPLTIGSAFKGGMWKCLETWLDKIQTDIKGYGRGEPIEAVLDIFEGEQTKYPPEIQNKYCPKKSKQGADFKDKEKKGDILDVGDSMDILAWKDISDEFTKTLIDEWHKNKLTFSEAKDWINTLPPEIQDEYALLPKFFKWLKEEHGHTPQSFLNKGDLKKLKADFDNQFKDKDLDVFE